MKNLLIMLAIGAVLGITAAIFDLSIWVVYAILIAILVIQLGMLIHLITRSKNLTKLAAFIDRYQKNPVYLYLHRLREGSDTDQIEALEQVVKKYPTGKYHAVYGSLLAFKTGHITQAKKHLQPIMHMEEGQYTEKLFDVLAGEQVAPTSFKKQWMNSSLEVHKAYMQKDVAAFERHMADMLAHSGGIQYYGNYYTLQQLRNELN